MKIILASGSPRRKELLSLIVPKFEIQVCNDEEIIEDGLEPNEQAVKLSHMKAKSIFDKTEGDRIVIGSDTIVVKNNKIYGKPKNEQNAKEIIKELLEGDKTHKIITGLSIIVEEKEKKKEYNTFDEVKVYFKDISDKEIEKWIATGKAMDKAGAYAMQNEFGVFIEKIEGNYTTAIGLPIHKVYDIIKNYI